MDADKQDQLHQMLEDFLNDSLNHMILSNSNDREAL